jgi:hypothetical protein
MYESIHKIGSEHHYAHKNPSSEDIEKQKPDTKFLIDRVPLS